MSSEHQRYSSPDHEYGLHSKSKADEARCRWEVCSYIGNWPQYAQCQNKHKVDGLWCNVHSPEKVAERKAAQDARDQAKYDKSLLEFRCQIYGPKWKAALEEIARGELNDPAGYAQMILDEHT